MALMQRVIEKIERAGCVAVFTGAGISTLCGIPDFRGPQGLYKQPDAERIFDIEWFRRDPSIYYKGCTELVYGLKHNGVYLTRGYVADSVWKQAQTARSQILAGKISVPSHPSK